MGFMLGLIISAILITNHDVSSEQKKEPKESLEFKKDA